MRGVWRNAPNNSTSPKKLTRVSRATSEPSITWSRQFRQACGGKDAGSDCARFSEEGERLLEVLERLLLQSPHLPGEVYSVAGMAAYPWVGATMTFLKEPLAQELVDRPAIQRWLQELDARLAAKKGMQVPQV